MDSKTVRIDRQRRIVRARCDCSFLQAHARRLLSLQPFLRLCLAAAALGFVVCRLAVGVLACAREQQPSRQQPGNGQYMEQAMQLTHDTTSCSSQQRDEIDLMDKAAANLARLDSTKRSAGGLMVQR